MKFDLSKSLPSTWVYVFAAFYFVACYCLALAWADAGWFDTFDRLVETDPNTNLQSFAHGWGRNAITHAFLDFFTIPIRALQYLSAPFVESDPLAVREVLALAVAPLFGAANIIVVAMILRTLSITGPAATLILLIFSASIAHVLFSVIPESYILSGFFLSCLLLYVFRCAANRSNGHWFLWLLLAILLSGATITNIAIFGLAYSYFLYFYRDRSVFEALSRATLISVLALVFVCLMFYLSHLLFSYDTGSEGSPDWIKKYITFVPSEVTLNVLNIFTATFNAFVALDPHFVASEYCQSVSCRDVSFLRDWAEPAWIGIAPLLVLAFSVAAFYYSNREWRVTVGLCIVLFFYNIALHSIFGSEMFLYVMHWLLPMLIVLFATPTLRRLPYLSAALCLMVLANAYFLVTLPSNLV